MSDTTRNGHGDDDRPADTTPEVHADDAAQQAGDAGASTPSDSEPPRPATRPLTPTTPT